MAEGVLFCIAEEILKNLGSRAIDEIASVWGFKDRLEDLKNTINTIKDVLLDAEDRQYDSRVIRGWLERLAVVVYSADDLFDKVGTVALQKQIQGGNKLTKEVTTFFSNSNQIKFALSVSQKIKTIRQELDRIVRDGREFAFVYRPHEEGSVISTSSRRRRDQTYSFVDADEVIGRDGDKKTILNILLASCETEDEILHVIPIVGIEGQGKTTLAQLIYNDPQVEKYFELRLWVCVSKVFDIKLITEKILKSATKAETPNLEMEQLQGQLRKELGDKRYLLVLDDVWNENREEWLKLRALLKIGRKGSKILVTTRSREVAKIMGTVPVCELQGLSEEKSWELFQNMAFEHGHTQQKPHLIEVGKEIVKKCANVPLAIRTVGSLLYGKDDSKWLSFKNRSLANLSDRENGVIDILKLSYQHLLSPLKNCFAYCALFPKDYEFDKEMLINLWMAEGFITPIKHEDHSLEELAEEYFFILMQRCFFQDIKKDEWGGISSCKMHDLMHDLAQQVAGVNCNVVANFGKSNSNQGIHRLSFAYRLTSSWKIPNWILNLKRLRTFLLPKQVRDGSTFSELICLEIVSSFGCLRVLDLHNLGVRNLPSSIGKLIHLRYLNLSRNPITELPDSITDLLNLQTLNLRLETLPKNMRKLGNLRSLDFSQCHCIRHMPSGLGELTSLHKLPRFTVNNRHLPKFSSKPSSSAKLSDLKNLDKLTGLLHIQILGKLKEPFLEATSANLKGKHGLTMLLIELDRWAYEDVSGSTSNHMKMLVVVLVMMMKLCLKDSNHIII
ncbi:putative disease resistance protein RGA3 [Spinacia oleracea]|uniref:Disease resistance protein RGA3 n=1 Tax=Spinacia oleracea TaxID=3562 RepID=A0ABM3QTF3_SPIOL|nr:putative disease resistance protein RGA3 [Spinacia oleracea]XP_056686649.1 putative disease resistance protein RGA3 [Spinacia oleracea]XP_056686650.1 putative disease resistance protein RGA3 [Spinacia oleracea]XP_056686651.1 putative disease resistance protein RGA3 [Spinacia oleracea]